MLAADDTSPACDSLIFAQDASCAIDAGRAAGRIGASPP
jgi:hypothetical protein